MLFNICYRPNKRLLDELGNKLSMYMILLFQTTESSILFQAAATIDVFGGCISKVMRFNFCTVIFLEGIIRRAVIIHLN